MSFQGVQVAVGIFGGMVGFFSAIFYLPLHWNIFVALVIVALALRLIAKPFRPRLSQ